MFTKDVYINRRKKLMEAVGKGIIMLLSNHAMLRNGSDTFYRFRQDSTFLYYTGIQLPNCVLILDSATGEEILFAEKPAESTLIWTGSTTQPNETAEMSGIKNAADLNALAGYFKKNAATQCHILPPNTLQKKEQIKNITGVNHVDTLISTALMNTVIEMRLNKEAIEIQEIEHTLNTVTYGMYKMVIGQKHTGKTEQQLAGQMEGHAWEKGCQPAYNSIVTRNGHILHNESYGNTLQAGDLLLIDAGAESKEGYATDITRTLPVSGKFTAQQKSIYQLVLHVQKASIENIYPGVSYTEVHKKACLLIAEGLVQLGLMQGNPTDAIEAGAHRLFFPHGLGHALGLDVHDLSELGKIHRSDKAGEKNKLTSNLRFTGTLHQNYVLTVEPGIYFIPQLMDQWQAEKKHDSFINYNALSKFRNFTGIRIEDDIVVEKAHARLLGNPIPKEIDALEN